MPDPWLLLAKAAINYSAYCGNKLMPVCPVPVEDVGPMNTTQGAESESSERPDALEALRASLAGGVGRSITMFDADEE